MYLVVGATGSLGGQVAKALLVIGERGALGRQWRDQGD